MIKVERSKVTNSYMPNEFLVPGAMLKVVEGTECYDHKTQETNLGLTIEFKDCALPFKVNLEHFLSLSLNDDFHDSEDECITIYKYYTVIEGGKLKPIK
jgi:hypothetical protein